MHHLKLLQVTTAISLIIFIISTGCTQQSFHRMKPAVRDTRIYQTDSGYYYFTEAQIQRRAGNLDKAIVLLKNAIQEDPDSLYLKRELATVYLQNKETENAIGVLEDIIKAHPNDVKSLISYALIASSLFF